MTEEGASVPYVVRCRSPILLLFYLNLLLVVLGRRLYGQSYLGLVSRRPTLREKVILRTSGHRF